MLRVTLFWLAGAMNKNKNKEVIEELTPPNVLGVLPPPCSMAGGLWAQYTLEPLLG